MNKFLRFFFIAASFFLVLNTFSAEVWQKGPSPQWHTRLETALAAAQQSNKAILVFATGSDWCGWCTELKEKVFDTAEFKKFAKKHLILLYIDSPTPKHPMGSKQRKYNDSIVKRLNLQGARPLVKILDPSGREIGEHIGYIHLPAFMNILYSILKIPNPPVFPAKQQFSTKTIDGKQVSNEFQITHWGTARNAVNKPFSSGIVTAVAPGEKLYLRVKYRISKNFSPTVYPKMYFTDCAIKILPSPILKSKSGEFICVIISRKTDNCDELHFDLHDQTSSARAYLSIPVRLSFDRKLLSPEAVSRENALKKQAENISIKAVAWGLSPQQVNRPIPVPPKKLRIPGGQKIYFKLRCSIPENLNVKVNLGYSWVRREKPVPCKTGFVIVPYNFKQASAQIPINLSIKHIYDELSTDSITVHLEDSTSKPQKKK